MLTIPDTVLTMDRNRCSPSPEPSPARRRIPSTPEVTASPIRDAEDSYVTELLRAYLDLPDTPSRARTADRVLARSLFAQAVPLALVHAAFDVACVRRLIRPATASPLGQIRSLHYFLPVVEELRLSPPDPGYIRHIRARLAAATSRRP